MCGVPASPGKRLKNKEVVNSGSNSRWCNYSGLSVSFSPFFCILSFFLFFQWARVHFITGGKEPLPCFRTKVGIDLSHWYCTVFTTERPVRVSDLRPGRQLKAASAQPCRFPLEDKWASEKPSWLFEWSGWDRILILLSRGSSASLPFGLPGNGEKWHGAHP